MIEARFYFGTGLSAPLKKRISLLLNHPSTKSMYSGSFWIFVTRFNSRITSRSLGDRWTIHKLPPCQKKWLKGISNQNLPIKCSLAQDRFVIFSNNPYKNIFFFRMCAPSLITALRVHDVRFLLAQIRFWNSEKNSFGSYDTVFWIRCSIDVETIARHGLITWEIVVNSILIA